MESMTGYSHTEGTTEQFSYTISIKSLNSKYLEIFNHLPRVLKDCSEETEAMLKKTFVRGKIELYVEVFDWIEIKKVSVNYDVVRAYYNEFSSVAKKLKMQESLDLSLLLSMDGVIHKERSVLSAKTRSDMLKAIRRSAEAVVKMRLREGIAIKKDLKKSLTALSSGLSRINLLTKDLAQKHFTRLRETVESMAGARAGDERLLSEIAILADKLDINEEKVRLKDHLDKFTSLMNEEGQIGKRLDFLAQELFREINTISSKSNSSAVAHIVVDMKNHVDKIREHCRNVV